MKKEDYYNIDKPKLLVVDDEPLVREVISDILQNSNVFVDTCSSSSEALDKISNSVFHIVLTDLMMENMNGLELIEAINSFNNDILSIVMTGYPSKDTAIKSLQSNVYDYIEKPFKPDELRNIIDRAVEKQTLHFTNIKNVKTIKDLLSKQKQKEIELTKTNEELNIKNIELKDAYKKLSENQKKMIESSKMASLGMLVAGVAHEINNPNSFISLNAPLLHEYIILLKDFLNKNFEYNSKIGNFTVDYFLQDIKRITDTIITGSDRIKKIVDNLKDFSRDTEDFKKDYYSVKKIINKAYLICGAAVRKKVSKVSIDISEDVKLYCDMIKIEQVIVNLLLNAADAVNNNKTGFIKVSTFTKDNYLNIVIEDNGSGISKEAFDFIFDPFFTTKENSGGTGLGLSIVYGIIKEHNGNISVDSVLGKKTVFTINLPYVFSS